MTTISFMDSQADKKTFLCRRPYGIRVEANCGAGMRAPSGYRFKVIVYKKRYIWQLVKE